VFAAVGLALLLAGWLRPTLARRYQRIAPPIPADARRWLLLFAVVVLVAHYGGKIYPDAMWGDIGFHSNRYQEVVYGNIMLLSRNRGVDFPYPPAFYLLLAPFALTGLDHRVLLQLGGALLNALSPFIVYMIAVSTDERPTTNDQRDSFRPASVVVGRSSRCDVPWRRGVLAAGIYSLSAATLMTTWWNFSTHIFAQFAHLLLITAIVLLWRGPATKGLRPPTKADDSRWPFVPGWWPLVGLFVLQSFVYLGHFGFWMNMSLLGAIGLAALLLAARRGRVSWRAFRLLLAAFVAAEIAAALLFYSAYAGLFLAQAQATAAGGLSGMQNRPAADRAALWETLWDAGFRVHFGFFPVPLALSGLALLWRRTTNDQRRTTDGGISLVVGRWSLVILVAGTFGVALLFGALPFVTRAALSTRWLMFSAWAVAVCAAVAARRLGRAGRAGRWLVAFMGAYVLWVTASMWLGALAWRIRPPEPF
jgi:hypothetical protein